MAYRTDYFLSVNTLNEEFSEQIAEMVFTFDGGNQFEELYEGEWAGYDLQWFDHDLDMFKLSKKFPDNIFTLSGFGENRDDIWVEYWKDGAKQSETMMFPPCDEAKMIPYEMVNGALVKIRAGDESEVCLDLNTETELALL